MGKRINKIITTKVDKSTYDSLLKISHTYGFRSLYELNKAIISCFLDAADRKGKSVPNEIDEMFDGLSPTPPYGEHKRALDIKSVNDEPESNIH